MNIGQMDRLIEIQRPVEARNSMGESIITWTRVARVWAKVAPLRASERVSSGQMRENKEHVFTLRYKKNITSDMRIIYATQAYRITGIAELGRQEGLELTAEYLQGRGEGDV